MPDWDADSPWLRRNLAALLRRIRDEARQRVDLSLDSIRAGIMPSLRNKETVGI